MDAQQPQKDQSPEQGELMTTRDGSSSPPEGDSSQPTKSPADWLAEGRSALASDLDSATHAFRMALGRNHSYTELSSALRSAGRPNEALEASEMALSLDFNCLCDIAAHCLSLEAIGRAEEALQWTTRVLALDTDTVRFLHIRALLFNSLEQDDEALLACNQLLEIKPNDSHALRNRLMFLVRLERIGEALLACDQLLNFEPNDLDTLRDRLIFLVELERIDEAVLACDQLLKVEPNNIETLHDRLTLLIQLGRIDEALLACDQLLKVEPNNIETLHDRLTLLIQLGRIDEALLACDPLLTLRPNDPDTLERRATLLIQIEQWDQALTDIGGMIRTNQRGHALELCDQILNVDPENFTALLRKSKLLENQGEASNSLQTIELALDLDPHNSEALFLKGQLLEALDMYISATRVYDQLIDIFPENKKALHRQAIALEDAGEFTSATEVYRLLFKLQLTSPIDSRVIASTTRFYRMVNARVEARDDFDDCLQLLNAVEDALPKTVDDYHLCQLVANIFFLKSYLLTELQQYEDAIDALHVAVDLCPNNPKFTKWMQPLEIQRAIQVDSAANESGNNLLRPRRLPKPSQVLGSLLAAVSLLNVIDELQWVQLRSEIGTYIDDYSSLVEKVGLTLFGWIDFGIFSISISEIHSLSILYILVATSIRTISTVDYDLTNEKLRFTTVFPVYLTLIGIFALVVAILLPEPFGTYLIVGYMLASLAVEIARRKPPRIWEAIGLFRAFGELDIGKEVAYSGMNLAPRIPTDKESAYLEALGEGAATSSRFENLSSIEFVPKVRALTLREHRHRFIDSLAQILAIVCLVVLADRLL